MQLHTITLPDDLLWVDEWTDAPVAQSVKRRLDGGLVIYSRAVSAGRSITLEATESCSIDRHLIESLIPLTMIAGATFDLIMPLRGAAFKVIFRHQDMPVLDFQALFDYADPAPNDWLTGKIKLMTV